MGKRGPQKKPDKLKRIEGNPGRRPLNDNAPEPTGSPVKPPYVKGYAGKIWKAIIASMPAGLYSTCDTSLLAAYCVAADLHRQSTMMVEKEGGVAFGENGSPYQSPWVAILNRQAQLLATLGSRLGLDPAARTNLKAPEVSRKSKFADLITMPGGKR